jgi:CSLREA domain-containing protein
MNKNSKKLHTKYSKILFALLFLFVSFLFSNKAEAGLFTKLFDFDGANGQNPWGSLIEVGSKLYGVTSSGGANGRGVIFEYSTSTNSITQQFDFTGTNGRSPYGSLISVGDKLYGMTSSGGANGRGVIFEYSTTTNSITQQFDFEDTNGSYPNGSLIAVGDKLYGITYSGGANNYGVIFEYSTTTNSITQQFDFEDTNGSYPQYGSLIAIGDKLYGMTESGGANNYGVIFEYSTTTNSITQQFDFTGTNGRSPYGSLISVGDKLYGMTSSGGANGRGVIFEYSTTTNSITQQFDFEDTIGSYPDGSLIAVGDKLYGMTYYGGANDYGVIFEYSTTTNSITTTTSFTGTNGSYPYGSLIAVGDKLYGMTSSGGANDYGVIFEYQNSNAKSITVNSLDDDGEGCTIEKCTLRDAIATSTTWWDIITFDPSLTSGGPAVITLESTIEIDHALIISGPGAELLTIDGNSEHMMIYISDGFVNISDLTFANGFNDYDYTGAVENYGDDPLTIDNCIFTNNDSDGNYGGAIYNYEADLTITNSTFTGNVSHAGGAIYSNGGDLTIENSTFSNNSAPDNYGGAIYYNGSDNLTITNSTFVNNTDSDHGSIESYADLTTITNSTFYNDDPEKYNGIYLGGDSLLTNNIFYSVVDNNCNSTDYTSGGHNIDSGTSCGFSEEGDVSGLPDAYENLFTFNGDNGSYPYGSLIAVGDKLYGMTEGGGANDYGVIFEYSTTTNSITQQFDFEDTNGSDPGGSLIAVGDKLYGMTYSGGANGYGVIFEYSTTTNSITQQFDFEDTNGSNPYGSLIAVGDKLYGMTGSGGANGYGVIFEYSTTTNSITQQFDFEDTNGSSPVVSLISVGDKLYGMTNGGGATGYGVIFEYDPADNTSTVLYNFTHDNGENYPYGDLLLIGNKLYGMTSDEDINGYGNIFSYDLDFVASPFLDPLGLQDNGGPVPTVALVAGSIAINAGASGESIPTTDARGTARVGATDIGAYEYVPTTATPRSGGRRRIEYIPPTEIENFFNSITTTETNISVSTSTSTPTVLLPTVTIEPTSSVNTSKITKTLSFGMTDPEVIILQKILSSLGLFNHEPTGYFGKITQDAVRAYQKLNKLSTVGIVGPLTMYLLNNESISTITPVIQKDNISTYNFTRDLEFGSIGDDVKALQKYLNTHGFIVSTTGAGSIGNETTKFGSATKSALIKFQKAKGITPTTGYFGQKTRTYIKNNI